MVVGLYVKPKADKAVSEWLYGDYDQNKYHAFVALYSVPGIHEYFDYLLDKRSDQEYLAANQMNYTDIHDPRKLKETRSGSALVSRGYQMISHNVSRLYDDDKDKKKKGKR